MKGVNYITDDKNRKTAVIIDLKIIEEFDDHLEDLFDIIIAESRADDEDVSYEDAIKELKKSRKL